MPTKNLNCPVLGVGKKIGELIAHHDRLELRKHNANKCEARYTDSEIEDARSRQDVLSNYATMLRAKSIEGALLQLALASSIFDGIATQAELAAEEDGAEEARVRDSVRAFNRLLYSVTDLLSDKCQVTPTARKAVEYYHSENCNPWVPSIMKIGRMQLKNIDDRLDRIEADTGRRHEAA